jgi:uncharacterized protein YfaT (DUF1175 family)
VRWTLAILGIVAGLVAAIVLSRLHSKLSVPSSLNVSLAPARLVANGYDQAVLTIGDSGALPPVVPHIFTIGGAKDGHIEPLVRVGATWQAHLRVGVLPGHLTVGIEQPKFSPVSVHLDLLPQTTDSASDGTPDFMRLNDQGDQEAFRRWFTFLAEVQYFTPAAERPAEIVDCSALLRYAYREALRAHAGDWTAASRLPLVPAIPSVLKYSFPHTLLGPALFRIRPSPYAPTDLKNGAFAQFANAETLARFNTFRVSRDVGRARPGDLLFFRQPVEHMRFHSMVFVGPSQIERSPIPYVVYHTGPDGAAAGEIRRLSLDQLLHFPDPRWQPREANPSFLGVFRWNILKPLS